MRERFLYYAIRIDIIEGQYTWIGEGLRANISFLAPFVYPFMLMRMWIPSA